MAKANHTACSVDGCNSEHVARGYCHKHYVQSRRGVVRKDATTCARCGAGFVANNVAAMYCSKKCKHAAWVDKNKEQHKVHRQTEVDNKPKFSSVSFNRCATCDAAFVSNRAKKYCCGACRPKVLWVSVAPVTKSCACCGKEYAPEYTGGSVSASCSVECRDQMARKARTISNRKNHKKYGSSHRKRARRAGVAYEPVNRLKVFERDGWRCQICGKHTPIARLGGMMTNAPELDHRVPLSKGGGHLYSNVQCACRQCNNDKGNKASTGQLPMFAA